MVVCPRAGRPAAWGTVWILQIFPAVAIGLYTRRLHHRALLAGWATGMAAGTFLVLHEGFSPVVPFGMGGHEVEVYAGLAALVLNLAVAVTGTVILDRIGTPRGGDSTTLPSRLTVRHRREGGASSS
jgi:SSS family solute:Na+ symporter